jgi:non-canonical purine NTP pyrophosphatase (RdgB/HAM1 family)
MISILFASQNAHKIKEVQEKLSAYPPIKILSLLDFSAFPEIKEDRKTFEGNSFKKAREVALTFKHFTLADDSGLVVDALKGAPGIYSARYAGEKASDEENRNKLLMELKDIPKAQRQAHFVCVLTLASPQGKKLLSVRSTLKGSIAFTPKGVFGFGYDPLFILPDGRTLAELPLEEKNTISHRAKALKRFVHKIQSLPL